MQGWRRSQEDAHLIADLPGMAETAVYGVFDGHAGVRAANIARSFLWNKIQPVLVERLRAGGSEELPPGELVAVVRRAEPAASRSPEAYSRGQGN